MFTGLIQDLGEVVDVSASGEGQVLTVATTLASEMALGDSVATNGVCLTVVSVAPADAETGVGRFGTEVMNESLRRSALAEVGPGAVVNLELAMRAGDRLGGHLVQGHVDGVGTVSGVQDDGFARRVTVQAGPEILRYVVFKGSICIDGVSLTVAELDEASFTVSLIPETLERTNLGTAAAGRTVNLEVDIVAKYVEKLAGPAVAARSGRASA